MTDLEKVGAEVGAALQYIARLFKDPKLTLVVRIPGLVDGDAIYSDDDLDEAIAAIERLKARDPARKTGGQP